MTTSDTSEFPVDPLRRLQAASVNYQQTARWLAGSFGSFGAVLVAGLSLAGLGGLPWWRLGMAVGGFGLALVAVALVIHRTALVAPLEYMTFEEVDVAAGQGEQSEQLRHAIERHDGLFPPAFESRKPNSIRSKLSDLERKAKQPDVAAEVNDELVECREVANRVLAFANHYEVKKAYERLHKTILVGAGVFAFGAAVFAWAANPPSAPETITVIVNE